MNHPPAFARWLLERVVPEHLHDAFVGDLEERYATMVATMGIRAANRWFWRETCNAPRTRMISAPQRRAPRPNTGDGFMSVLRADLRFAWRMLMRRPGFTTLAVFTLALGIGATTAIFSVVYPILFESLPYPNADRVMMVWEGTDATDKGNLGYATYVDILEQNRTFSDVAVVAYASGTMTGRSEPQFLEGDRVSASFFQVLGVKPALGRAFRDVDNLRGSERVIIISNALWRNRFGGDSSIIGKPLMMETDYTIVGVMPASFENLLSPTWQFLLPIRYDVSLPQACRSCRHLRVVARRKEGVTTAQAQRDLSGITQGLKRDYPNDFKYSGLQTNALSEDVVKNVRPALLAVLGAVALVLLVACLNVMNLLLARGAQREGEFAVRAALGAGRSRLVRQLLSESVLLAFLGGIVGIAVAFAGVRILVALSPADLPRLSEIRIQGSVLLFALATTTVVGIAFGVVPALQGSRSNLHDSIRRNTRRSAATSRFTRSALVISEVALALVLLVGSGLLFRSMEKLFAVNPGFDSQNLLTMQIQGGGGKLTNDKLVAQFMADALQAVRSQPAVLSAALTSQLPLTDERDEYGVHFETRPPINPNDSNGGRYRFAVTDGYFETMKIPLVTGRYFAATDKATSSPVAIINQSYARRYFGDVSPVGQRVKIGGLDGPWREIVGIVGDVKHESLSSTHFDAVYLPEVQWRFVDYAMTLVVRPRGDAMAAVPSLRKTIWAVDKDQPIIRIATAEQLMAEREAERRFALVLFEGFAIVALVLAAAGIYGVLAGTVSERGRELGVRAALGATGRDQVAMVVRQGMTLTIIGMIVGLAAALASSRVLSSMLFDVSPLDPITYAGVIGGLGCVALLACWIPARRASQTSPLEALKSE